MGISKGSDWGAPGVIGPGTPRCETDREVSTLLEGYISRGAAGAPLVPGGETPRVHLLGGDLFATLGGRPAPTPTVFTVDAIAIRPRDAAPRIAIAHVVCRRRLWAGEFRVAMSACAMGDWDLAPRGHPNDGFMDTIEGRLAPRERLEASRRARSGSHLPHPGLSTARVRSVRWSLDRPTPTFVDGVRIGSSTEVELEVVPDALEVVI